MPLDWTSVLIGVALGGGYGAAAFVMNRLALRYERHRFMALCMGGMLARMVSMLAGATVVLAFVPVRPIPFVAALVVTLLAALAVEVLTLYRGHATQA